MKWGIKFYIDTWHEVTKVMEVAHCAFPISYLLFSTELNMFVMDEQRHSSDWHMVQVSSYVIHATVKYK